MDPTIGRFITEDPIRDGLNWYTYANNNPVMFIDPTGLWSIGNAFKSVTNAVSNVVSAVVNTVSNIMDTTSNIAISVVNALTTGASSVANTASSSPTETAPPSIDGAHAGEILASSWGIAGIAAAGDGPLPIGDAAGIIIGVGGTLWAAGVFINDNYEAISYGIGASWNWFTGLFNSGSSALTAEEAAILNDIVARTMAEFSGEIALSSGKADPKEFSKDMTPYQDRMYHEAMGKFKREHGMKPDYNLPREVLAMLAQEVLRNFNK